MGAATSAFAKLNEGADHDDLHDMQEDLQSPMTGQYVLPAVCPDVVVLLGCDWLVFLALCSSCFTHTAKVSCCPFLSSNVDLLGCDWVVFLALCSSCFTHTAKVSCCPFLSSNVDADFVLTASRCFL